MCRCFQIKWFRLNRCLNSLNPNWAPGILFCVCSCPAPLFPQKWLVRTTLSAQSYFHCRLSQCLCPSVCVPVSVPQYLCLSVSQCVCVPVWGHLKIHNTISALSANPWCFTISTNQASEHVSAFQCSECKMHQAFLKSLAAPVQCVWSGPYQMRSHALSSDPPIIVDTLNLNRSQQHDMWAMVRREALAFK